MKKLTRGKKLRGGKKLQTVKALSKSAPSGVVAGGLSHALALAEKPKSKPRKNQILPGGN